MSSYTDLALDPTSIRADLTTLGIDETLYSDSELTSVMTVTDIILRNEISNKTDELELEMYDFEIQSGKLQASQIFFSELMTTLDNDSVTLKELMAFMTTDYTFLNIGDASKMTLDYEVTAAELSSTGFDSDTTATYSTMQEYLDGLTSGDYEALFLGLKAAIDDGDFDTTSSGIYSGSTGTEYLNSYSAWTNFANGSSDYFVKVFTEYDDSPDIYFGVEEVRNYLVAKALQETGFIGEDVYLEPILFASSSQPTQAGALAAEFVEWHQIYYGNVTIDFDESVGALTVNYNAPAATRELGHELREYFDEDNFFEVKYYQKADAAISDAGWQYKYSPEISTGNTNYRYNLFSDFDLEWYFLITSAYAFDDLNDIFKLRSGSFRDTEDRKYYWEYRWDDRYWSDFSGTTLDADQIEKESIKELYTDIGGGVEGFAAQGELNLLSISTLLTEWSEYHAGWDTIHKYVTDAIDRVIEMMK